jgi:tetratricopeptide (TPR) repeat protein
MSLISDFINVLSDDEIGRLQQLQISGKEKELLDILLRHRMHPEPGNDVLVKELDTTAGNCDKLKSVLLLKAYYLFVPEGGGKLLAYLLGKRGAQHLLIREIDRQEKEALQILEKQDLIQFYKNAFSAACGVNFKNYDDGFTKNIGRKWIELSDNKKHTAYEVDAKLLWCTLSGFGLKGEIKRQDIYDGLIGDIEKLAIRANELGTYEARYHIHYLKMWLFNTSNQAEKALEHIEAILAMYNEPDCRLMIGLRHIMQFKYAETLYLCSRYNEAYERYCELFVLYEKEIREEIYHIVKFVQASIVAGHPEKGEELLNNYCRQYAVALSESSHIMTSLHYAKVYMAMGQYEKAYSYVIEARNNISKSVYVQYEIELRNLECFYFYFKGDHDFAAQLARKNIKFLGSKGLIDEGFAYVFQLVIAIIQAKGRNRPLKPEHEKIMALCQTSAYAQYGILLNRMYG